jgi:hypothetical protein
MFTKSCMRTLLRCMQVNKRWAEVIRGSTQLMKHLYLIPQKISPTLVDSHTLSITVELQRHFVRSGDKPSLISHLWITRGLPWLTTNFNPIVTKIHHYGDLVHPDMKMCTNHPWSEEVQPLCFQTAAELRNLLETPMPVAQHGSWGEMYVSYPPCRELIVNISYFPTQWRSNGARYGITEQYGFPLTRTLTLRRDEGVHVQDLIYKLQLELKDRMFRLVQRYGWQTWVDKSYYDEMDDY